MCGKSYCDGNAHLCEDCAKAVFNETFGPAAQLRQARRSIDDLVPDEVNVNNATATNWDNNALTYPMI